MKKLFTYVIALISLFAMMQTASALVYNVTVPAGTKACYIAGTMNNWTHQAMTRVDDTHYTLDIPTATATDAYKYCSGPNWVYEEADLTGAKLPADRTWTANDVVANWLSVFDPANGQEVTIEVLTPLSTIECYLVGNFNNWASPSAAYKMTKGETTVDGIIFSITIQTPDITTLEYKFASGPAWDYEQSQSANFVYAVDGGTVVVPSFKAIYDPSKTGDIHITATVPAGTDSVWIQGSHLGWDMTKAVKGTKNADGTFSFTIPLVISIEYRLYNKPDWTHPEVDETGKERANRKAVYPDDANINITVVNWMVPTGIHGIKEATNLIYTRHSSIVVEGVSTRVEVFDLAGRILESGNQKGTFISKALQSGMYVIRVDGGVKKVAVK